MVLIMTSGIAWRHLDPIKIAQLLHFHPELREEMQRYESDDKREADMDEQRLNEKEK